MSNYYFNGGNSYQFGEDYELSPSSVKMEPVSPASSVSSSTNSSFTGRRKRNASQASMSAAEAKKLKKYEMDPTNDPAVKNAIAAKANREKHKQEFQKMKTENQELKAQDKAKDKVVAFHKENFEQAMLQLEEERRRRLEVEDQFSSFVKMFVNGQPAAIPTTNNNQAISNVNAHSVNSGLDQWDQSDDLGLAQLSQGTLDELRISTAAVPFPEVLPIDEDFSNDPLMAPQLKEYDLPSTPEEYLDIFRNLLDD